MDLSTKDATKEIQQQRQGEKDKDEMKSLVQEKKINVPPWASLLSGASSGLASCLLLQPMDFLKTRMQQEQQEERQKINQNVQQQRGGPRKRTERLIKLTNQVIKQDGWLGLWRGTVPTVARNVPGVAMYFYSVSEVRALFSRAKVPYLSFSSSLGNGQDHHNDKSGTLARLTVTGNLVAGAMARVAVGFILSPVTIVKARFESSHFSKDAYPSLIKALVQVYQSGGIRGLFRGFSATALRDAPYAGLYLAIYEKSKDALTNMNVNEGKRDRGGSGVVSASGLIAGTLATLFTHPFDIIKTRMQTLPQDAISVSATTIPATSVGSSTQTRIRTKPPSLFAMMRYIAQTDGMGAYLDGLGLRCARKAASSAIGWTIFEGGRGIWVKRQQQQQQQQQQQHIQNIQQSNNETHHVV